MRKGGVFSPFLFSGASSLDRDLQNVPLWCVFFAMLSALAYVEQSGLLFEVCLSSVGSVGSVGSKGFYC